MTVLKRFSLFAVLIILSGSSLVQEPKYVRARVMEIMSEESVSGMPEETVVRQVVLIRPAEGPDKGKILKITLDYSPDSPLERGLSKGNRIIVYKDGDSEEYVFYSFDRTWSILIIIFIFCLTTVLIGKGKGIRALASLGVTLLVILKLFIPLLLAGVPIVLLTLFTCALVTVVTLVLLNGFRLKTLAALTGIVGGLAASGFIALLFQQMMKLSGINMREAQMLRYMPQQGHFSIEGLLFAGIVIGALGAVMDVGVELASSMKEIKDAAPHLSRKAHMKAGMNVGRDIIGTMTNTLILAYTGASLPLLLLFHAYQWPAIRTVNLDMIASEILRGLAGSLGLIVTVPATVAVSAFIFSPKEKQGRDEP